MRLTITVASQAKMKLGMILYKPNQPNCFQTNTVTAPTRMPASAPLRVIFDQNSDKMMAGSRVGVLTSFHGHHHDRLDYSAERTRLGFYFCGVGLRGITDQVGRVILAGEFD
jgi:hypothetical protein